MRYCYGICWWIGMWFGALPFIVRRWSSNWSWSDEDGGSSSRRSDLEDWLMELRVRFTRAFYSRAGERVYAFSKIVGVRGSNLELPSWRISRRVTPGSWQTRHDRRRIINRIEKFTHSDLLWLTYLREDLSIFSIDADVVQAMMSPLFVAEWWHAHHQMIMMRYLGDLPIWNAYKATSELRSLRNEQYLLSMNDLDACDWEISQIDPFGLKMESCHLNWFISNSFWRNQFLSMHWRTAIIILSVLNGLDGRR